MTRSPADADALTTAIVDDIRTLIECESPTADIDAIAHSADVVASVGAALLGDAPERIVIDGTTHLKWAWGDSSRVLVLCHHDTVWPFGSLESHPFLIDGDVLTGPGCFDMKAGLVMAFHAIAALADRSGVTLLVTGDEETGSPSSRSLIEDEARQASAVLVLEASAPGGAMKTERKGASLYELEIVGRAAHAGLEPERGVNAAIEAAHQILAVGAIADSALGTSVTPTLLRGGTTMNTVPAEVRIHIDARARTIAEQTRVDQALHALEPVLAGAKVVVHGGPNRPPLELTASGPLFDRAQDVAARIGHPPLTSASVGGGSDGNFTAAVGTPTLDGLGAVGGGAHGDDEHVLVSELVPRTELLSALITDLLGD